MDKDQLLKELEQKIQSGEISREEAGAYMPSDSVEIPHVSETHTNTQQKSSETKKPRRKFHVSTSKILYVIGGIVAIIGLVLFIVQVWEDIGATGHIVTTLGMGLLLAGIGSWLLITKPETVLGDIFHTMGAVLIPIGSVIALYEFNDDILDSPWHITIVSGLISLFYLLLALKHKRPVITFFVVAFTTLTLYLVPAAAIAEGSLNLSGEAEERIFAYLSMVIGVSYVLLARGFSKGSHRKLVRAFDLIGSTLFLGAVFNQVVDGHALWAIFYFAVIAGVIAYASVTKNKVIFAVGSLFLIIHIFYGTSRYFADSVGWPIALVVLGFIFMGLGYVLVNLNKKYLSE